MATYQQILTKINGITDNGNNTAAEVRSVLTDMLNFSGEGFEVASDDLKEEEGYTYHYSFKGIKDQCCNLFLFFNVKESTATSGANTSLMIEISEEDFKLLTPFMPIMEYGGGRLVFNGQLCYVVPETMGTSRIMNLVLLKYDGRLYIMGSTTLAPGEAIMVSVAVNFKPFRFPVQARHKKEAEALIKNLKINS